MSKYKPKISTNSISAKEKKKKIEETLRRHPEGLYPKTIAAYTGVNVSTVKSALKRMSNVRKNNKIRGFYNIDEKPTHSIFDWSFHNLVLSCELPSYEGELVEESYEFGFLKLKFTIGAKSKKATLHISSEPPINVPAIMVCFSHFELLIKHHASIVIKEEDVWIKSIEFNKDYTNLRLDGANCITLTFLLTQYKLYNKKSSLREEFKLIQPLSSSVLRFMFENGGQHAELYYKVDSLDRESKIHTEQLKNLTSLIINFLEERDVNNNRP